MNQSYYKEKLAASKLRQVYESAPPRVRQYLEAEAQHVCSRISRDDLVLELGCGYGRILGRLAESSAYAVGIDSSEASLREARRWCPPRMNLALACMDASHLAFADNAFDIVVCIQNGISAFNVDREDLIREAARVTLPGGLLLFSSYTDSFWGHRLDWFERQVEQGLLGPIDYTRTRPGEIWCTDGFHASTVNREEFQSLLNRLQLKGKISEIDSSSLFCEIYV
ncbi:class I SAM-dependent methyltransferase [bacterium]|nr:class I SAM-dependent methyltransferase [bacterium]